MNPSSSPAHSGDAGRPVVAAQADDRFGDLVVPTALQASLDRHRDNLRQLVANLEVAGVDAARIEASVTILVDSYKTELLRAIKLMVEQNSDRP